MIPDAEKNHLQRNHLHGNIKQIITSLYLADTDDTSQSAKSKLATYVHEYNPEGYLVKTVNFDADSNIKSIKNVYYHANDKENYWEETDFSGTVLAKCEYIYDVNQYLSEERYFKNATLLSIIRYKTDGIGDIIEMVRHESGYQMQHKMHYNEKKLLCRIDQFDPAGKLFKYFLIEYDDAGNELNRKVYSGQNRFIEYTYTQYDDAGKLCKVIYEDKINSLRTEKLYKLHDSQRNWLLEEEKMKNSNLHIRERKIIYY